VVRLAATLPYPYLEQALGAPDPGAGQRARRSWLERTEAEPPSR